MTRNFKEHIIIFALLGCYVQQKPPAVVSVTYVEEKDGTFSIHSYIFVFSFSCKRIFQKAVVVNIGFNPDKCFENKKEREIEDYVFKSYRLSAIVQFCGKSN